MIRYFVPLDDPAMDVVTDFSNCVRVVLEDRLKAVHRWESENQHCDGVFQQNEREIAGSAIDSE